MKYEWCGHPGGIRKGGWLVKVFPTADHPPKNILMVVSAQGMVMAGFVMAGW